MVVSFSFDLPIKSEYVKDTLMPTVLQTPANADQASHRQFANMMKEITNSISILTLSSLRYVFSFGILNIRTFVSLFFLSLIYFTVSFTPFPLFWVVCGFLLSSSFGLHVSIASISCLTVSFTSLLSHLPYSFYSMASNPVFIVLKY